MHKKIQILLIPLILFQLLCLYACAVSPGPVFEKDEKKFGVVRGNFTGRWYDYYERALSYIDGGFYDEALFVSYLNFEVMGSLLKYNHV